MAFRIVERRIPVLIKDPFRRACLQKKLETTSHQSLSAAMRQVHRSKSRPSAKPSYSPPIRSSSPAPPRELPSSSDCHRHCQLPCFAPISAFAAG